MERNYDVIIVGGGATGTGTLRDLTRRGLKVALVEQGDLASGTSGRFHGLLHSGGRYAVKDPESARECIEENTTLRRIAPHAIDVQEGLFVQVEGDDPAFADRWAQACAASGIPVREIGVAEALRRDPCLHPRTTRVFTIPDGSVDSWRLTQANVRDAQAHGADVLLWHRLEAIRVENGRVTGVELEDLQHKARVRLGCRMLVNATGAWAGRVGRLADIDIPMALDRGTMIVFDHYYSPRVVNRLRLPGDGDILVPVGSVSILGTSAVPVQDPEERTTDASEVQKLIGIGAEMIPALASARVFRTFTGIRPLYRPPQSSGGQRDISRGLVVLDHEETDGLAGMVTIVGGKLTTYRLMAEKVSDVVATRLGVTRPCTTAVEPLLRSAGSYRSLLALGAAEAAGTTPEAMNIRRARRLFSYLPAAEAAELVRQGSGPLLCECEGVDEAELVAAGKAAGHLDLADVRRRTRLGMGPCQGTLCAWRAGGVLYRAGLASAERANEALVTFLDGRWQGVRHSPTLQQLRAAEVTRGLYLGNLNIPSLPGISRASAPFQAAAAESEVAVDEVAATEAQAAGIAAAEPVLQEVHR